MFEPNPVRRSPRRAEVRTPPSGHVRGRRPTPNSAFSAFLSAALALGTVAAGCAPDEREGAGTNGQPDALSDSATFVVRLGVDTTSVERIAHRGDEVEIVSVSRTPETVVREGHLALRPDGTPERFEVRVRRPLDEDAPEEGTTTVFHGDSAVVEVRVGEEVERSTVEARPGTFPWSLSFLSLAEVVARHAVDARLDTVWTLSGGTPLPIEVGRPGSDSLVLETGTLGSWSARTDGAGRIAEMDAGALGRTVERTPWTDIRAMAAEFAERDARGEGMGPLSPRDTAESTVDGARIAIDYGRPSARGRTVFGGLVPFGEVWRLGANLATHLETDRDLELAGTRIPEGTYTLFAIPGPEEWTLIVNGQTGQAGTQYDEAEDVARIPLEAEPLDSLVNRFTISVEDEGDGGILRFLWEETEAWVPVRAAPSP